MHALIAALFALLLLPAALLAAPVCGGTDLATTLSDTERQEIRALTEATPYARGNHWIAERNGQTLHLIGTMHLNDPRMIDAAHRLAPVLEAADLLLLEVAPDEMADFTSAENMSAFLLSEGPTLIDIMGAEKWAAFSTLLRHHGIPPWMAAKMRPWMLDQMLSMPACIRQDKQAAEGLDMRLEAIAADRGIPLASLETMQELTAIMNAKPLPQQVEELLLSQPLYEGAEDYLATLREAYFAEDSSFAMELLRRVARTRSGLPPEDFDRKWEEFQGSLLVGRNALWLPRILERNEPTVVIAVGVAHLSGETGLLSVLEQAGFALRRAIF
ncbi:TraB/GumN family protein [Pseudodonghicola flavimaris]|uniref:TraB/GumN family protein n=1 Tax=Pseudodonghicola flavimaris TaxID=3050036 RepID=A0ABT7EYM2_9RHOB|nr:TraB/GumN family protein [Pseudodonghicola flavimaris]MDK3017445.1 TraB/GumN family protein [Pseudodonghicola flavimaris]